jgi:hypothetical protein
MIAPVLLCVLAQAVSVLAAGAGGAGGGLAFRDLERAVLGRGGGGRAPVPALSLETLRAMSAHDAALGLEPAQNALLCGPYSAAADVRSALESTLDASHFHPVYFSQKEDRACFALSSYAETETDAALLSLRGGAALGLPEGVTVSRLPHALKVDASVLDVARSLRADERFVLELLFGLGAGDKGMHAARPAAAVAAAALSAAQAISSDAADSKKKSDLLDTFFWSSRAGQALEHPLAEGFSRAGSPSHCPLDNMHMELGRGSASLTSPRGMPAACLLQLAAASALQRDVALVLAHKGHSFLAINEPEASNANSVPFEDADPASDQNAFIQSGNSVDKPYSDMGINGTSYVVGYIDTGVDDLSCFLIDTSGNTTTRTPGKDYAAPVTEPWRRKVIQYIAWGDGDPSIGKDHGTWVAGSTAGQCIDTQSPAAAYDGVAPGAKVTMFDIDVAIDSNFVNVPSLYDICLPPAYSAGARIHSDSWGTPGMTSQTSKSLDVDQFTYDNPDFLFIVAATNDGNDGYKSVGSPGVSKNALTIGATAADHDEVVYFSSVGPVYDGSIKPDIVAPGQHLMSAGVKDLTLNETTSCNVQELSGTSMATPIAAGAAVLVREYLESPEHWGASCTPSYSSCPAVNPDKPGGYLSAALLKAALVHSGESVHFHQSFGYVIPAGPLPGPPPDVFQGWGQVLLKNLLPIPRVYAFNLYVSDYQPIQSMQARHYYVEVTNVSLPLRATIAWTDPPNAVWAAKNLLNDLDLIVMSPTGYYHYGNNNKGDEHNPVERIVLADGLTELGVYTVIVVAKQLATPSQDFSIVITCIGEVDESLTYTAPADLSTELNNANATEACQGSYHAPTGNTLVRFQLEDWQGGASWEGLSMEVRDNGGGAVSSCAYTQNAETSTAPYTRSSQCTACLPGEASYTAMLNTSAASADGADLIRVASPQCDNVFLSSRQQQAAFLLSDGLCNYCPSGFTRVIVLMKANVTDDDYMDYSW